MVRRSYILIIFGLTKIVFGNQELCSNDPCTADNLLTLSDVEGRSPMYSGGGSNKCDAYISEGWYSVNITMSNKCTGLNNCGTLFSVWLNGSEPRGIDGVVERNVCISGPESCCATSLRIKIKKCSSFTAYCLKRFDSCPIRYCFGEVKKCNDDGIPRTETNTKIAVTTTDKNSESTTVSVCTSTSPRLEDLYGYGVNRDIVIGIIVSFLIIQVIEIAICLMCIRRRNVSKEEQNTMKSTYEYIDRNRDESSSTPYTGILPEQGQNVENTSEVNESQSVTQEIFPKVSLAELSIELTSEVNESQSVTQEIFPKDSLAEPSIELTSEVNKGQSVTRETYQTLSPDVMGDASMNIYTGLNQSEVENPYEQIPDQIQNTNPQSNTT